MRSPVQKKRLCEVIHCGWAVLIGAILCAVVDPTTWFLMVTAATVAVKTSQRTERTRNAGVGLKVETDEEKPFPCHVD